MGLIVMTKRNKEVISLVAFVLMVSILGMRSSLTVTSTAMTPQTTITTTTASSNDGGSSPHRRHISPLSGPPFQIVQFGPPRSASTFQHELLSVLVHLKTARTTTSPNLENSSNNNNNTAIRVTYTENINTILQSVQKGESFVIKNHFFGSKQLSQLLEHNVTLFASSYGTNSGLVWKIKQLDFMLQSKRQQVKEAAKAKQEPSQDTRDTETTTTTTTTTSNPQQQDTSSSSSRTTTTTSSSTSIADSVIYTQLRKNIAQCSLCEIERGGYRTLFDLTDEEYDMVYTYMSHFEKIRKCCGSQASKQHIMSIHGCYHYDNNNNNNNNDNKNNNNNNDICGEYNMTQVELDFTSSVLYTTTGIAATKQDKDLNPRGTWTGVVGDCERLDALMVSEKVGFNLQPFKGCEHQGLYST